MKSKIKLYRILNGINEVYISKEGQLFVEKPNNFTGLFMKWNINGKLSEVCNYKNGNKHGKSLNFYKHGDISKIVMYNENEILWWEDFFYNGHSSIWVEIQDLFKKWNIIKDELLCSKIK